MANLIVNNELVMYGPVGYFDFFEDAGFTSGQVIEALATMEGDITVRLNSGGGIAMEGSAIYNALKRHNGQITVKIDGIAASAASVIAMAGDVIEMPLGSLMMIHEPSGITLGPADEHRRTAGVLDTMTGVFAQLYAEKTGLSENEIRQMMKSETWLSPDEAMTMGFATSATEDGNAATADANFDYRTYLNAPDALKAQATDRKLTGLPMVAVLSASPNPPKENTMTEVTKVADIAPVVPAPVAPVMTVDNSKVVSDIVALCGRAKMSAVEANKIIVAAAGDFAKAQTMVIDHLADKDLDGGRVSTGAVVLTDGRDRFKMGLEKALLEKAGMKGGERNEFTSLTLKEAAREALMVSGLTRLDVGKSSLEMVGKAFTMSGQHSTSDFASVLQNIANKSMLIGFEEAGETFQMWTSTGTLSDFKTASRVDAGMFPSLTEVPEGADYTYATMSDRGVNMVLATFGKMFSITRQAVINDDLGAFTRVPAKMGRAANRTVGNLVYAKLTAPAVWSDSVAFFHADHGNLGTGALTTTALDAGRAAMARQTDPDDHATGGLNIRPAFLIVPTTIYGKAMAAMEAEFEVSGSDKRSPNYARNMAQVVSDARLDTASTAAWYLAASPSMYDTIEVSYLDGNSNPTLEQRDGWNADGVEFKVRLDAGVTALDYRGFYKSSGS